MKLPQNDFMDHPQPWKNRGKEIFSHGWHPGKSDIKKHPKNNQSILYLRAEWKESHLNARHSGSMKMGYKEELPGRSYEHQAHKRKKAPSTARGSSEDRPGRYDCSPARRQRMESVSSKASDCSLYSPLGSDCSVDSALGRDCSLDSPLGSDCSVDRPMESDTSVSRTENSNPEPSVSSHDQHHGNRAMDDELFKKIFEKLLERRTYMWRKALLNKRDSSKGRSVRSRKSPEAKVTSATSRYSVGSPETTRCSVGSPEARDCPVDSPSIYSVRRVSPQKPQRSQTLGSPLAPVNSATSDCSVDWILSFTSGRSRVNASENIFTEVEMEVLEKTSLKTFLISSHRRAAAAGSEEVHAFSQLATYVRNFIKEYPEDLERISKDDLNNLNEKDSFTASLLPPSAPARVISMDSPMASVSSVASDCSVDRFLNFSSGNPQSSQPCRHCGSSRINEGLQRDHSSFKKPFPGKNAFIRRSSQSSLPKASPAASEAYVDSPLASVSSVASDCSEDRFINFSSGNPQSSQPCSSPARVISMDSPLASVSSVASDCSVDRIVNFSSGNPQSFQQGRSKALCSPAASTYSLDSPMASVSSVASDCSVDRIVNFSSEKPQSQQGRSKALCSPAASAYSLDSPMASVSSVASDCSVDRIVNFSSGNPQSFQQGRSKALCSPAANTYSLDSPMASVSSVASDCSVDRIVNFSSEKPQSCQQGRAAAGSDAPPVSLHDSGSSCLDTIETTFTDDELKKIVNYLQTNPNKTSLTASMGEQVSLDDDLEDIVSIINDKSIY